MIIIIIIACLAIRGGNRIFKRGGVVENGGGVGQPPVEKWRVGQGASLKSWSGAAGFDLVKKGPERGPEPGPNKGAGPGPGPNRYNHE